MMSLLILSFTLVGVISMTGSNFTLLVLNVFGDPILTYIQFYRWMLWDETVNPCIVEISVAHTKVMVEGLSVARFHKRVIIY